MTRRRPHGERTTQRLLLATLRESEVEGLRGLDRSVVDEVTSAALVHRSIHHNVAPWLHASPLRDALAPADRELLDAHCLSSVMDQMRLQTELHTVADALTSAGVHWCLVKGPAVAELLYPTTSLRVYHDLDVLVRPDQFPRAVERLEANGAKVVDDDWALLQAEMRGQLELEMPLGSPVDLHWHLLNRGQVRAAFSVPVVDVLDRRRTVAVNGRPIPTTDAATTLVHLCLHAALSGGHRLCWLKDVERAVTVGGASWDSVVEVAHAWRARLVVGVTLLRVSRVLGARVPEQVIDALVPARWAAVAGVVERLAPVAREQTELSLLRLTTPLLRDDGVGMSPRLSRWTSPRRLLTLGHGAPVAGAAGRSRETYLSAVCGQAL